MSAATVVQIVREYHGQLFWNVMGAAGRRAGWLNDTHVCVSVCSMFVIQKHLSIQSFIPHTHRRRHYSGLVLVVLLYQSACAACVHFHPGFDCVCTKHVQYEKGLLCSKVRHAFISSPFAYIAKKKKNKKNR